MTENNKHDNKASHPVNGVSQKYVPQNILVTGGAGFIGSNIVIHLVKKYPHYKIVNLDKLDYCSNVQNLKEIENAPNYRFIKGNILSADLVAYILKSEEIDTILHFAAQTHVDNSFGNSVSFTQNNVLGTHILLETCLTHHPQLKRFIHVSTDEVYGQIDKIENPAQESRALEPSNPYAASKAGAEYIVKAYYRSFKMPVVITRSNNIYGPHQYPEKVIPKFICRLERGLALCVHGNGEHIRNYIYITDFVEAFDIVIHNAAIGEIYNIGSLREISNLEVARSILRKYNLNNENEHITFVEDRAFNDFRYAVDSSKLYNLGWKPKVDWDEGLEKTIEWYKKHVNRWANIEGALAPHPKPPVIYM